MTFTMICRSLILYILILFLLRIMGKRQIGEMQPFELVITLILADLATIPMAETALPLIQGIIPILTLACLHYFICFLSRYFLNNLILCINSSFFAFGQFSILLIKSSNLFLLPSKSKISFLFSIIRTMEKT